MRPILKEEKEKRKAGMEGGEGEGETDPLERSQ